MSEIKHIEFEGHAFCDVLNNHNLVYTLDKSNCHSCIIKCLYFYGGKYGMYESDIKEDIKKEFKRIELEEYNEDFETLLKD